MALSKERVGVVGQADCPRSSVLRHFSMTVQGGSLHLSVRSVLFASPSSYGICRCLFLTEGSVLSE